MSEKLPRITGRELMRALRRAGWNPDRQRGSHVVLVHRTRPGRVVVPMHAREIIPPGTLGAILTQSGLSVDELRELL